MRNIVLEPILADQNIVVQFSDSIKLDKNVIINVPNDFIAHVYLNETPIARLNQGSDINLLDKLGKKNKDSIIRVAFVRTNDLPSVAWGFGQININNASLNETYTIGANGTFLLKIKEPAKLINVFGVTDNLLVEQVYQKAKAALIGVGSPLLSEFFSKANVSVFEINALSGKFASELKEETNKSNTLKSMGVEIQSLLIRPLFVNEDDLNRIKESKQAISKYEPINMDINAIKQDILNSIGDIKGFSAKIEEIESQVSDLIESQDADTTIEEIDNLRTELYEAINEIKKNSKVDLSPINDKLNKFEKVLGDMSKGIKDAEEKSKKELEERLKEIDKEIKLSIGNQLQEMRDILNNECEELESKMLPLNKNAEKAVVDNIAITTDLLIENAKSEDDYVIPAAAIYSNVEKNLIEKFNIPHKGDNFYMGIKEFEKMTNSFEIYGKQVFKTYKPRRLQALGQDVVEMPPEFRFFKTGMNASSSLEAAKNWTILNKFRHLSSENRAKLETSLKERNMTRKDFLKYAVNFFRTNGLYTKD